MTVWGWEEEEEEQEDERRRRRNGPFFSPRPPFSPAFPTLTSLVLSTLRVKQRMALVRVPFYFRNV
jgi:hypothetical protein